MAVRVEPREYRASVLDRLALGDVVSLACAVAMLAAFFLLSWFNVTGDISSATQAAQFSGPEVLAWNDDLATLMDSYEARVDSQITITEADIARPLLVIPLAGFAAVLLSAFAIFQPRYRRLMSALTLVAGLFALLYYVQFFTLDRRVFMLYYEMTRQQTGNITLTYLAASGFWVAFFAALGLLIQFWIGRPAVTDHDTASVPLLDWLSGLLEPFRRLRARYQDTIANSPRYAQTVNFVFRFQSFFGLIIIIVLAIVFSPVRGDQRIFLNERNLSNVARDVSETGIMAVGQLLVILVAGIDLSVGSVVALAATGSAFLLMRDHVPAIPAIIIVLGLGAVIGWWNGWISERFKVPSFVTTLAMLSIARGLAHIWSTDIAVPISYEAGGADPLFEIIGERINGVFPVPAIIMFVVAIIMGLILHYTAFGRHIYAIGGNETAARLSGVVVQRIKITAFVLSGFFASMAGIVHASQLNQGSPNEAVGYELNAIAAVVIGGASLMGGKGTIVGAIAGAFILGILDNMLSLNNVNSNVQLIVKGLLVVAAVVLQQLRPREAD